MTKVVIVNERDQVIGSMEKNQVGSMDFGRVTGLWITNSKREVLLTKRKMDKKFSPGCWEPAVAGTVEEGETYESNIYKEAEEELGIHGQKFEPWMKLRISSAHQYFVQIFKVNIDWPLNLFKPDQKEFDDIKWMDYKELVKDVQASPRKYTAAVPLIIKHLSGENG